MKTLNNLPKSKLENFVNKSWNFAALSVIIGILINIPLNFYGDFRGYKKSGKTILIPDSDYLAIFQRFAGFLILSGLFIFILASLFTIFLEIKKNYEKNLKNRRKK